MFYYNDKNGKLLKWAVAASPKADKFVIRLIKKVFMLLKMETYSNAKGRHTIILINSFLYKNQNSTLL